MKIKMPGTEDEVEEAKTPVSVFGSAKLHPYSVCVALGGRYAQLTISDARAIASRLLDAADWAFTNSANDGIWLSRNGGKDLDAIGVHNMTPLRMNQ